MRSSGALLLALDTSTRTVGLALYDGRQVLSEAAWTSSDYHTVELAPAIADAFAKTGQDAASLGALAVAIGPGSFTVLRVGLALAKCLAMARKLPLIGVPTLDALAAAQPRPAGLGLPEDARLAAVLRAGRGRLAVSWYAWTPSGWQSSAEIKVYTPAELVRAVGGPTLVCGELSEEERDLLQRTPQVTLAGPAASLRRPAYLAELGWKRWKSGQVDPPAGLAPIYLHYNDPIPA
ncbi:MAG: tRNA (adenosine(37)-N6)-threonylcarbamoyltransferase complex dimerization subunit type 1 TsaB [Chloroflexota bacterium]